MTASRAVFALCVLLLGTAADRAGAQSQSDPWGKPADLKPLLPPIIPPPLLPPHSTLTPGSLGGDTLSPSSPNSAYDAARSAPAPGLRLTIPTR
ncbi:MAG TPA: hypothetical protein VJT13_12555 [Xanthobacteraceae bacterium]|nr:hypothetical protein [Xanthobacteraceae bacterium]